MTALRRFLNGETSTSTGSTGSAPRPRYRAAPTIGPGLDAVAQVLRNSNLGRNDGSAFNDFEAILAGNPIVFRAWVKRQELVKQARFQWQRMTNGTPGDLWGNQALRLLENPWPGGSTADLLKRIELDTTRAGICAVRHSGDRLDILDPYSISSVVEEVSDRPGAPPFIRRHVAWMFQKNPGETPVVFHPEDRELAVIAPVPDPSKIAGGLSWIRPALLDIRSDDVITHHRNKYFENAATPNMVIKSAKPLTDDQFDLLKLQVQERHEGTENAFRTMIVESAHDVETVGSNLREAALVDVQDAAENRISVASGVPAPLLGVKIGASPTYNNLQTARREMVDTYARPTWSDYCQSLEAIFPPPTEPGSPGRSNRLWYADAHISALQQDADDAAGVRQKDAATIRQLVDGGFTAESAVAAVKANDFSKLVHSGLLSVQLQPPGATAPASPSEDSE